MDILDWNKIRKEDISSLKKDKPIFIVGSREISENKIKDLIKKFNGKKVLWGVLKDEYINGLEGSPQFKTLKIELLESVLSTAAEKSDGNFTILNYFQRDTNYILKTLDFLAVILINGSWYKMIHLLPEYWTIVNKKIPYKLISPFINETEARLYWQQISKEVEDLNKFDRSKSYEDKELMKFAAIEAKKSFDWVFQTGCVLTSKDNKILLATHNNIIPFETVSMHFGSVREQNYSAPGDLNFYDTNHAEVEIFLQALKLGISTKHSKLFINLLPCPTCARMIADSEIEEIVYQFDHSEGYAYKLFESAGKKVRRLVN